MKFTTANVKKPHYQDKHVVFLGTHTGSFKQIEISQDDPYQQINIEDLNNLTKGNGISVLSWGHKQSSILLGRDDGVVKRLQSGTQVLKEVAKIENGKIKGVCDYEENLILASEDGKIHTVKDSRIIDSFTVCDNISKMRQCPFQSNLIATGGKERKNNFKIIDMTVKKPIFETKNVPNDELDLEVPIWDTDFSFLSTTTVATCSRYGYIRFYDTKKQRRPVFNYKNDQEQISYNTMTSYGNFIYAGSNLGVIRCFDTRSLKHVLHTYKGFVGSTTSMVTDVLGKYLAVGGLDRYVRIYNAESTELLYQCYTKAKVTDLLLQEVKTEQNEEESEVGLESENSRKKRSLAEDPEYEELFGNMQTVLDDVKDEKPETSKSNLKKKKKQKK